MGYVALSTPVRTRKDIFYKLLYFDDSQPVARLEARFNVPVDGLYYIIFVNCNEKVWNHVCLWGLTKEQGNWGSACERNGGVAEHSWIFGWRRFATCHVSKRNEWLVCVCAFGVDFGAVVAVGSHDFHSFAFGGDSRSWLFIGVVARGALAFDEWFRYCLLELCYCFGGV